MTVRYLLGDTREMVAGLPDQSVDLVLVSPPFLALRSYLPADHPDKGREIGGEADPGAFIDVLLDLVEEWDRVLAPHGSIAVELGDTYSGSGGAGGDYKAGGLRDGQNAFDGSSRRDRNRARDTRPGRTATATAHTPRPEQGGGIGWPLAKSLCLIPESFRWALAYGRNPFTGRTTPSWRVRNVVRWCRPNPPVGALGDKFRPATSEMVVACKSRTRWFDLDAVREPHQSDPARFTGNGYTKGSPEGVDGNESMPGNPAGAPPLDWWEIPTQPYAGAHYATWPERLCVRPILSMCPERVCVTCGEPSRRITEPTPEYADRLGKSWADKDDGRAKAAAGARSGHSAQPAEGAPILAAERLTVGWSDCGCSDDGSHWRPGVVLDPFGGSGTTGAVAQGLGRDAILIDLDERNLDLARQRIGMFLTTEPARRPA